LALPQPACCSYCRRGKNKQSNGVSNAAVHAQGGLPLLGTAAASVLLVLQKGRK
jgi:hypothetical protein